MKPEHSMVNVGTDMSVDTDVHVYIIATWIRFVSVALYLMGIFACLTPQSATAQLCHGIRSPTDTGTDKAMLNTMINAPCDDMQSTRYT